MATRENSEANKMDGEVRRPWRRLGDILVEEGVVSEEQLAEALKTQEKQQGFLGRALVELGYLTQERLAFFLVKQCKIPHLNLLEYQIDTSLLEFVPKELCSEHSLIPIDKLGRILTVAMVDPLDQNAIEAVSASCPDLRIKPILCNWQHFEQVAAKHLKEHEEGDEEEYHLAGLAPPPPPSLEPEEAPADTDADELTAALAGLMEEARAEEPKPEAVDESPVAPPSAPLAQPSQAAPFDVAAFGQVMRDAMHDAMREWGKVTATQAALAPQGESAHQSAEVIAQAVRDSISEALRETSALAPAVDVPALGEAMREAMREAVVDLGKLTGGQLASGPSTTGSDQSAEAIAQAVRDSVGDTLRESMGPLIRELQAGLTTGQPAAAAESGEALAEAVRVGVSESLRDSLVGLVQEVRATVAQTGGPSSEGSQDMSFALSTAIQASITDAMQSNTEALVREIRALAPADAAAQGSSDDLTRVVRESVGDVLHDALDKLSEQVSTIAGAGSDERILGSVREIASSLGKELEESFSSAVSGLSQSLQQDSGTDTSREMAEVIGAGVKEALKDTTEALRVNAEQARIEAETVAKAMREDLESGGKRKKSGRHASVTAFTKPKRKKKSDNTEEVADERVLAGLDAAQPLEGYQLKNFFPGKVNAFVYELSKSVAEEPGGEYNPFFLHGSVGLGKTHLINGIGNQVVSADADKRVGYVSASHFARCLKEAMDDDAVDDFRENYCHWDVLILDDIQFLGGRVEAQEEFFHIFNVLHQEGRQIIIAGDKPPERLGLLEQRLVSRFSGGVVSELKPPDRETRSEILKNQAKQAKRDVPDDVLMLIAMRMRDDVRKMTGALRKVLAYSDLTKQPLSYELADEVLNQLMPSE